MEIPVWLRSHADRPKWVSGIQASTTCGDVLASVLRNVADLNLSEYVLVEQWRGVERPLANSAKISQIWSAWGDEQERVRIGVKKIKIRDKTLPPSAGATSQHSTQQPPLRIRKVRRRNSNGSAASVKQASDTVHPRKMRPQPEADLNSAAMSRNIEDMMKIILAQGRMIYEELHKLDETTVEGGGALLKAARSYDVGLNRSAVSTLERSRSKKKEKSEADLSAAAVPATEAEVAELEEARRLTHELSRLYAVNDELAAAETKLHLLSSNLGQLTSAKCDELTTAESEAAEMRLANRSAMDCIERNKEALESLDAKFKEKREAVKRLEYDVNVIEKEGRKLHKEYEKVMSLEIPDASADDDQVIYSELKELQLATADAAAAVAASKDRKAADSPEGSTSGVSSSLEESEPAAAATDKVLVKKRIGDSAGKIKKQPAIAAIGGGGDDSDTGLSSLHSSNSSDDGGGAVGADAGVVSGAGLEEKSDFGTLV